MSKLIEKINDLAKPASPAMGFRRAEVDVKRLSLLVIVEMTGRVEAEIKEIAGLGVSAAVINNSGRSAAALTKELKACHDLITGLQINGGKSLNGLKNADTEIDFIICARDMPLKLYAGKEFKKAGRVIRLDTDLEPGQLRAVNGLYPAVDAVLIDIDGGALTVGDVLGYRKVAEQAGQPLIASLNTCLGEAELIALREAGISALLLPADWSVDNIRDCLDTIASLPKPVKKKDKERGSVSLLPHLSAAPKHEEDSEEDDD